VMYGDGFAEKNITGTRIRRQTKYITCNLCGKNRLVKPNHFEDVDEIENCQDKYLLWNRACGTSSDRDIDAYEKPTGNKNTFCPNRHKLKTLSIISPSLYENEEHFTKEQYQYSNFNDIPTQCSKCSLKYELGDTCQRCPRECQYSLCQNCANTKKRSRNSNVLLRWMGNKDDILDDLPAPRQTDETIVEYMAGGAVYATKYGENRDVVYNDTCGLCYLRIKYLQHTPQDEIRNLQPPNKLESLRDENFDNLSDGTILMLGLEIAQKTYRMNYQYNPMEGQYLTSERINYIADNKYKVQDWKILKQDFKTIPINSYPGANVTHFFDGPYSEDSGQYYKEGRKNATTEKNNSFFNDLKNYILAIEKENPESLIIVCEGPNANWVREADFSEKFTQIHCSKNNHVIFVNTGAIDTLPNVQLAKSKPSRKSKRTRKRKTKRRTSKKARNSKNLSRDSKKKSKRTSKGKATKRSSKRKAKKKTTRTSKGKATKG